jgi:hypothetical protein
LGMTTVECLYAGGLALGAEAEQAAFPEGEMQLANLNLT